MIKPRKWQRRQNEVVEKFSVDGMVEAILKFYQKMIAGQRC